VSVQKYLFALQTLRASCPRSILTCHLFDKNIIQARLDLLEF
jgi:hypothetical protein